MRTKAWRGYGELAAAMALAGSSFGAARVVTDELPVFAGSALRFGLALAMMAPLMGRRGGFWTGIGRRELGAIFLLALTGSFGFSIFLLYGLRLTSASEGGIVASTTPAAIAAISVLWLGERLRPAAVVGIFATVAGVMIVTGVGREVGGADVGRRLLGDLLVFGAVVCEALFAILGKAVSGKVRPLAIASVAIGVGFLLFLPFAGWEALGLDVGDVASRAWVAVFLYALATVLAYLLWYDGLTVVPASAAGVFTGIIPVSALVTSYLVLGEPFRWLHLVGAAAVLAGIVLTVRAGGDVPLTSQPDPPSLRSSPRSGEGEGDPAALSAI